MNDLEKTITRLWEAGDEWRDVTRALNELYERDPRFRALRHVAGTTLALLRVDLRDHAFALDFEGTAAAAAVMVFRFGRGFAFNLMLAQALAQVFSGLAVGHY